MPKPSKDDFTEACGNERTLAEPLFWADPFMVKEKSIDMRQGTLRVAHYPVDGWIALYAAAPNSAIAAVTDAQIREVFLAHGFCIKHGRDDLKPYVYEAARALLGMQQMNAPAPDSLRLKWMSEHEAWIGWNREGDTCGVWCHGDEGEWVRMTPLVLGKYESASEAVDAAMAEFGVAQINAPAGTPALPSREVTGSPGAPVVKECSICRGTGREGIPGKCCSWCDGTGKFMRGRALAEALGSDGQGNRASQQPPVSPSSRGTAASQPASSAEEDESLG